MPSRPMDGPWSSRFGAVIMLITLGGCAAVDEPDPGRTVAAARSGDRVLLVHTTPASEGMDSQLRGLLAIHDHCLGIDSPSGFVTVVWPHGTTWRGDDAIELAGASTSLGGTVALAGGMTADDDLIKTVRSECGTVSDEIFDATSSE